MQNRCLFTNPYQNGIFQGQLSQGRKEGLGFYLWNNGQIYLGNFSNNYLEGSGLVIMEDMTMLLAQFKNNKIEGEAYLFDNIEQQYKVLEVKRGKIQKQLTTSSKTSFTLFNQQFTKMMVRHDQSFNYQAKKTIPLLFEFNDNEITIYNNPLFYKFYSNRDYFKVRITDYALEININSNYMRKVNSDLVIREGYFDQKGKLVKGIQYEYGNDLCRLIDQRSQQFISRNQSIQYIEKIRKNLEYDNFIDQRQNKLTKYSIINPQVIYYESKKNNRERNTGFINVLESLFSMVDINCRNYMQPQQSNVLQVDQINKSLNQSKQIKTKDIVKNKNEKLINVILENFRQTQSKENQQFYQKKKSSSSKKDKFSGFKMESSSKNVITFGSPLRSPTSQSKSFFDLQKSEIQNNSSVNEFRISDRKVFGDIQNLWMKQEKEQFDMNKSHILQINDINQSVGQTQKYQQVGDHYQYQNWNQSMPMNMHNNYQDQNYQDQNYNVDYQKYSYQKQNYNDNYYNKNHQSYNNHDNLNSHSNRNIGDDYYDRSVNDNQYDQNINNSYDNWNANSQPYELNQKQQMDRSIGSIRQQNRNQVEVSMNNSQFVFSLPMDI